MLAGFLVLLSGTAIAQGLALIISPILTRLYTPEDFGVLGGVLAISSILATFFHGRLNLAIAKQVTLQGKQEILAAGFALVFLMAALGGAIVYILGFFGFFVAPRLTFCALAFASLVAILDLLNYYNSSIKRHKNSAKTAVFRAFFLAVLQVSFGVFAITSYGDYLVFSVILAALVTVLMNFFMLNRARDLSYFFNSDINTIKAKVYESYSYIIYSAPQGALAALSLNAVPLIFSIFFSSAIVGYYWLAYRILLAPIGFLGGAYRQAIYPFLAEGKIAITVKLDLVAKHSLMMSALICVSSLVLLKYGEVVFSAVFGSQWGQAGVYAGWLAICFGLDLAKIPSTSFMHAHSRHKVMLVYELFLAASRVFSVVLFAFVDDMAAIIAFALVSSIFSLGLMVYVCFFYKRI